MLHTLIILLTAFVVIGGIGAVLYLLPAIWEHLK